MLRNKYGYYMQAHELFPVLGFARGGHLPREGFEPREVQGTMFRCIPARPGWRKHRIEYLCSCGRWLPYGRAGQHNRACPSRQEKKTWTPPSSSASLPSC